MAEHQLPKLTVRVRFPSSAPVNHLVKPPLTVRFRSPIEALPVSCHLRATRARIFVPHGFNIVCSGGVPRPDAPTATRVV